MPLKYVAAINERSLSEDTDPKRPIRYVDISTVGRGALVAEPETMRFADAPSRARRLVRPGDTIVSTVRTYLRAVWPIEGKTSDLVVSTGFAVLSPRTIDPRYFSWWIRSDVFIEEVVARSVGVSYPAINALELGELKVRVPPQLEQRAIADYLDTETARIDALIAKKRRMLELLNERRVALASEMTVGLSQSQRSATPIPTIPTIPSHWEVRRNRTFAKEVNRPSTTGTEEMLSVSHLTGVTPRSEKTVYMFEAESTIGYKVVHPGDLAINTMWAWMGAAGVSEHIGIVSPAYGVYELDRSVILPAWYDLLVRTPAYVTEMTRFSRGVTSSRLRLYPDEFLALFAPIPPIDEQQQLVLAYKERNGITTAAISRLSDQIDLLVEHRQALITAAVTGELDVSKVA